MSDLFNSFEMLEQIPTELMTEITEPAQEGDFSAISDHTKLSDTFTPEQNNTGLNTPNQPLNNNPEVRPQQMNAGNLITGDMAVGFLDMALPVVLVLLIEKAKGVKINKKYFQATADEKKTISPVLQNWLNSVNFNIDNPLNALLLTLAFIYGTKTIEVLNMPEQAAPVRMPNPHQQEQPKQKATGNRNLDGTIKKDGRGRPRNK